jgi:tRNA(Ile)-lysidine synthase
MQLNQCFKKQNMKKRNLSAKKKIHNFYLKKLNNPRIKKIYLEFEKNLGKYNSSKYSIAVSGGVDSMALAFLAKCHSIKKNLNHFYFTVDHKLRSSSSKEASQTIKQLRKFGIICEILTWKNNKTYSNFQAKARDKRYELIFKKSLKNRVDLVLTAHQKNDLYENFFIRLLRGSGLKGLSSFKSNKTKINKNFDVYILRPLLNISKQDLSYITRNTFNFNIEDPSNENDNYLRIKIRKLINRLNQYGLTFEKFNNTLKNLNASNKAIEFYVKKNIKENTKMLNKKKCIIINEIFFNQPDEIVFRSLSEIIHIIGNKSSYTRGKKILSLISNINSAKNFKKKTLSGCIFEKSNKSIIISREN